MHVHAQIHEKNNINPFTAVRSHFGNIRFQLKLRKPAVSERLNIWCMEINFLILLKYKLWYRGPS